MVRWNCHPEVLRRIWHRTTSNADASEYLSMTFLRIFIAVCGFASFYPSAAVLAQVAQPQQQHPAGLETLSDDKLITDLAGRGLTNLLNRAYDVNNVPQQQRGSMQPL